MMRLESIKQVQQSLIKTGNELTQENVRNQVAELLLNKDDESKINSFE